MEQKQSLQQMVLGDLDSYMKKNETQAQTYTIHKNKFKVDKRLKYKSQDYKSPIAEHSQENLIYSTQHYFFTDMFPRTKDIKERINKWDIIKIKSFCMAKENISKMKREPTLWKNIFENDIKPLDKGLVSKIHKVLIQFNIRKQPN